MRCLSIERIAVVVEKLPTVATVAATHCWVEPTRFIVRQIKGPFSFERLSHRVAVVTVSVRIA